MITLEAAVEWTAQLASDLRGFRPELHIRSYGASNQPQCGLSGKFHCAPLKHFRDMTNDERTGLKDGLKCVMVHVSIEWGGHTHHLTEPIPGARVSVSIEDRRRPENVFWTTSFAAGHYDAKDRERGQREGIAHRIFVETLEELAGAVTAAIVAGGPIHPPTLEAQAQAANADTPSEQPDDVTSENARTRGEDGKWLIRLKATGIGHYGDSLTSTDFAGMIAKHGGKVLYEEPALAAGFVGTFTGGSLREVCYDIDGLRRYGYALTSVMVDDWSQEVWVTDHRLTADAAATTLESARKMATAR